MNRDFPVSGQVTQSGHSDEDREEEIPEVDLGGQGQPRVGARTSGAAGQLTHVRGRDPDGSGGPWPLLSVWWPTCLPFPLLQSRGGNGLSPPFILRSQALPSRGLHAFSAPASCPISRTKGEPNGFPYHLGCPSASTGPGTAVVCLWCVRGCLHTQCTCRPTDTQKSESAVAM